MTKNAKKTLDSKYDEIFLEQYKIMVNSAIDNSKNRNENNKFYLGVLTSLIAIAGFALKDDNIGVLKNYAEFIFLYLCIFALILSFFWLKSISSYSLLNKAKFLVIHDMEKHLPYSLFDIEHKETKKLKYKRISYWETGVAYAFLILALISLIIMMIIVIKDNYLILNEFFINLYRLLHLS